MNDQNKNEKKTRSIDDIRKALKIENYSFDLLEISFQKISDNSDYHIIRIKARWAESDLDPGELSYICHRNILHQAWEFLTALLKNEKASNNSPYCENDFCIFETKKVTGVRNLFPCANQKGSPYPKISCYRHPDKSSFYVLLIDLLPFSSSHSESVPHTFQISPAMLDQVHELLSQHLQLK